MRVTFLTTVAAAVLSMSVAALAQTGGGTSGGTSGGAAGGAAGGTSGSVSGSPSGGASTGTSAPAMRPSGSPSGGTAQPSAGASGSMSGTTSSGTTSGTASGSAPHTTGSTSTNVTVSNEQRTEISHAFRSVQVEPLTNVNFSISVGAVVPASVTTLHTCPSDVVRILNGLPECRYMVVRDKIVIVEPSTRKIVTVIERQG
ncbi:DUF1236 domain-containing protein [Microvirga thermotolerans]|uniref:DUF1236 domain-containing protein n=1 Tax=Microvirga thermotolerans TaxID=2651334 RepID=A0A5P9JS16_9HYPH|nr:DUF1236 domain-containing protein [Microvirga thermotolerans]QFU14869.1 DUF1236 domain-containing protein [Microvirga thermotolerans]